MVQKALSDLAIQNLKTEGYFWDKLPGFGIRVGKKRKSFVIVRGGRRQTLGVYPHLTLTEARKRATFALFGTTGVIKSVPTRDALEVYLNQLRLRPKTVSEYKRILNTHFLPKLGDKDIAKIVTIDVLNITDKLLSTPTECRHAHAAMKTFFNWCVPRYISQSPMNGLKLPTKPNKRSRILTDYEIKAIWFACNSQNDLPEQFKNIVKLLILTGQRRGEIAALKGIYYAHNQQTITLPATLTKNKREHTFPLSPLTAHFVHAHKDNKNLWFPVQGKKRLMPFSAWSKNKKKLDQISGVTGYTLHDIRRTYRSTLGRLGIRPEIAERLVNHISAQTDMEQVYDLYSYLPEMQQAVERHVDHLVAIGLDL